jgi:hypothetical protein
LKLIFFIYKPNLEYGRTHNKTNINGSILIFSYKRVLRSIIGEKRDEVTGDWRKLHNEELHNL